MPSDNQKSKEMVFLHRLCFFMALLISFSSVIFAENSPKEKENNKAQADDTKEEFIKKYFSNKNIDRVEGFWMTDDSRYEIAIIKNSSDTNKDWEYKGIILNSTTRSKLFGDHKFQKGELKLLARSTASNAVLSILWLMRDRSRSGGTMIFQNENVLSVKTSALDEFFLYRTYPKNSDESLSDKKEPVKKPKVLAGSGFFITKNHVVTNCHVIGDSKKTKIIFSDGKEYPAKVIGKDSANDLAILEILEQNLQSVPIYLEEDELPKNGESVFTIGYPLPDELGVSQKISEGIINNSSGIEGDNRFLQISIPIQPGNSGGPLFNSKGGVIGVVTMTLNNAYLLINKAIIAQNVNFAIKIDYLRALYKQTIGKLPDIKTSNEVLSAAQIAEKFKSSVVFIVSE